MAYQFPIEIIEYIDDIKVFAYLDKNDINEKAKWTPLKSPPPLSIHQALQAVQKYIRSHEDFTRAPLISIELKQIPHHKDYWHYLVKVRVTADGKAQPHFFVVMMDGKVVSALREPESIK
jgi:hypothetical protein